MPPRAATLLSFLSLALAATALTIALGDSAGRPTPSPSLDPDAAALDGRLVELERRLAVIESRPVSSTPVSVSGAAAAPPERVALPAPAEPETAARLRALERAVAELRSELRALGPMPETLAGIVKALADKNLQGHGVTPEQRQRRRELWMRFLELAPDDQQAPDVLTKLVNDCLGTDARLSLALLDQWERRVAMPPHDAAMLRANARMQSGDSDGARQLWTVAANDGGLTDQQRVKAAFWHAHSWKSQGRYAEARREFEALIASYAGRDPGPAIESLVQGARGQIGEMERWQQRK